MSVAIEIDQATELRRLSRVFNATAAELEFLKKLSGAQLMQLRTQTNNRLLLQFEPVFRRLGSGGGIIPDVITVKLCTKVFGPRMTANLSYYAPAARATRMGNLFTPEFLTEVAREMIPERAEAMLQDQPVELMQKCAAVLISLQDHYVMGAFADFTPIEKLMLMLDFVDDPLVSLKVSCFAQRKDRMAALVTEFSDQQVETFIQVAHESEEHLIEILRVALHLSDAEQLRMKRITEQLGQNYVQRSWAMAKKIDVEQRLPLLFADLEQST